MLDVYMGHCDFLFVIECNELSITNSTSMTLLTLHVEIFWMVRLIMRIFLSLSENIITLRIQSVTLFRDPYYVDGISNEFVYNVGTLSRCVREDNLHVTRVMVWFYEDFVIVDLIIPNNFFYYTG